MIDHRRGMTLIEAMAALLILSIIMFIVCQMISSGRRGTLHSQETAEHHLAEVILSRAMEQDFKSLIPGRLHTIKGDLAAPVRFDPTPVAATLVQFSRFDGDRIVQVQYHYDVGRKEVLRQEIGTNGVIARTDRFGTGMVTHFILADCSAEVDGSLFWLSMTMKGKLRTTDVDKVFPTGFPAKGTARAWNFHLQ